MEYGKWDVANTLWKSCHAMAYHHMSCNGLASRSLGYSQHTPSYSSMFFTTKEELATPRWHRCCEKYELAMSCLLAVFEMDTRSGANVGSINSWARALCLNTIPLIQQILKQLFMFTTIEYILPIFSNLPECCFLKPDFQTRVCRFS